MTPGCGSSRAASSTWSPATRPSSSAAERRSRQTASIPYESAPGLADRGRAPRAGRMAATTARVGSVAIRSRSWRSRSRRRQIVGPDVELTVAEAVDPQHLGDDPVADVAGSGTVAGSSDAMSISGPSSANSTPLQRWAAAGANTSRPANVEPADQLVVQVGQSDGAPAPPAIATAGASRPLSGPTMRRSRRQPRSTAAPLRCRRPDRRQP